MKHTYHLGIICLFLLLSSCGNNTENAAIRTGAQNTDAYLSLLEGKKVGILTNHTALIDNTHLVDSLSALGVDIQMIFAPEHGFRGDADAGALLDNYHDAKTGIRVVSVYGSSFIPADSLMQQLDVALYDIQDVGLRFYTYLSSMYNLMEACARNGVPLIIMDRPNPNGHLVSGPVLDMKYKSFVGIVPIPVVHGMTLGEMAGIINGECWLPDSLHVDLTVIPCQNYTHSTHYELPIKPSPNLPNNRSIYLYPSLCLFEATRVSLGRGTDFPFQVYGHPDMT
ncbi:MAG TPA: exo-beta-N-acetylmuramidase NamZ domain-containing protein, partial [Bacteroidales bacterium]|nr:exo-beta-N-acetylmuramidase NamZ domain-containing protein [Bacteroidales bacterium]